VGRGGKPEGRFGVEARRERNGSELEKKKGGSMYLRDAIVRHPGKGGGVLKTVSGLSGKRRSVSSRERRMACLSHQHGGHPQSRPQQRRRVVNDLKEGWWEEKNKKQPASPCVSAQEKKTGRGRR